MDEPHTEVLSLREENARLLAEVRALQQAGTAAKEASAAKTRFLAMMSHEIRTPLSGIIGLADLLALGRLDQEQRAYNQAIRGAGASLICLLDEILDLSRVEAGHLDLEDRPFETAALVEGAAELLAPRAQGGARSPAPVLRPRAHVRSWNQPVQNLQKSRRGDLRVRRGRCRRPQTQARRCAQTR